MTATSNSEASDLPVPTSLATSEPRPVTIPLSVEGYKVGRGDALLSTTVHHELGPLYILSVESEFGQQRESLGRLEPKLRHPLSLVEQSEGAREDPTDFVDFEQAFNKNGNKVELLDDRGGDWKDVIEKLDDTTQLLLFLTSPDCVKLTAERAEQRGCAGRSSFGDPITYKLSELDIRDSAGSSVKINGTSGAGCLYFVGLSVRDPKTTTETREAYAHWKSVPCTVDYIFAQNERTSLANYPVVLSGIRSLVPDSSLVPEANTLVEHADEAEDE